MEEMPREVSLIRSIASVRPETAALPFSAVPSRLRANSAVRPTLAATASASLAMTWMDAATSAMPPAWESTPCRMDLRASARRPTASTDSAETAACFSALPPMRSAAADNLSAAAAAPSASASIRSAMTVTESDTEPIRST